jgi:hypothetical protein
MMSLNYCIGCGLPFITHSHCPGHVMKGVGVVDHCQPCCDAGKCPAISDEFKDTDQMLGSNEIYIQGYPERVD